MDGRGRPGARTQPADPHSPARSPAAVRSPAQGGDRCGAPAPRCGPLGPAARTRYVSPNPRPRLVALRGGAGRGPGPAAAGGAERGGGGRGGAGSPGPAVVILGLRALAVLQLLPRGLDSGPSSSLPSDTQGFPWNIHFKSFLVCEVTKPETPLLVVECVIVPCVKEIRFTN